MTSAVNLDGVTPAEQIAGEDESETRLLWDMLHRAETYLRSFKWCPSIVGRFLGFGVGGVVGVFLFKLAAKAGGTDDFLWVVVGDVPSAYLVTDDAPDSNCALSIYCDMMDAWAHSILAGSGLNGVFPVAAPATPDNARMLLSRTRFIRERLIPICRGTRREK